MASRKGKSNISHNERKQIAAGKLANKTNAQIAQELGRDPDTIKKVSKDERTVTLILALKREYDVKFAEMFKKAVRGLDMRLSSRNKEVQYAAANQLLKYITAGDPPLYRVGDQGTQEGDFTLEEMMISLRQVSVKKAG